MILSEGTWLCWWNQPEAKSYSCNYFFAQSSGDELTVDLICSICNITIMTRMYRELEYNMVLVVFLLVSMNPLNTNVAEARQAMF